MTLLLQTHLINEQIEFDNTYSHWIFVFFINHVQLFIQVVEKYSILV